MKQAWAPLLTLVLLALLAVLLLVRLEVDHRIDAFLPPPSDAHQAMVMDQIGSGAGGRLIFAAISGDDPDRLVEASREAAEEWRSLASVVRVDNGELWQELELLDMHRFALLPDIASRTEPAAIESALAERISELALAGSRVRERVGSDPLGLVQAVAERLAPAHAPETRDGVWLEASNELDNNRALLIIVSAHPPFEIAEQARLIDQLRQKMASISTAGLDLTLAGAPIIAVDSAERSRTAATRLSMFGGLFVLVVLLWAWRSPLLVMVGAIPLATGVVCGLLTVTFLFDGRIHGLTLAFGFTLLGVAIDYPVHLLTHSAGRPALAVRNIRAPLILGAASTVIAYLAVSASASPGLAQMGAFSAAGLAGAAAATLLLPLLGTRGPTYLPQRNRNFRNVAWLPAGAGGLALIVLAGLGAERWSNDLTRLSPIDADLLQADIELRRQLGGGDVRYLLVASADALEDVLRDTEDTLDQMGDAVDQGLLSGWQAVSDLVPSRREQQRRLAAWPSAEQMAGLLGQADARFNADAFAPFLDALDTAAEIPPITPQTWQATPLAAQVNALLTQTPQGWRSIITPVGLNDPPGLADWLGARQLPAELIDLRATSESMVASWRRDAGISLAAALALIAVFLWLQTRKPALTVRIMLPPLAAAACTAAVMSLADGGLTIVHLVGVLLVAGVGLDFSLFAHLSSGYRDQSLRTVHAVNICALSTGGVFLILGQSQIGMLRMLGLTVALGVLLSWIFARLSRTECPLHSA